MVMAYVINLLPLITILARVYINLIFLPANQIHNKVANLFRVF